MKPGAKRMYTYQARVLPVPVQGWWSARPGDFTLKTPQPLRSGDTVENRGVPYQAVYVFDDKGTSFALIKRSSSGGRKPRRREDVVAELQGTKWVQKTPPSRRNSAPAVEEARHVLMPNVDAVYANLPSEQQTLFARQLQRLVDLYQPETRGG